MLLNYMTAAAVFRNPLRLISFSFNPSSYNFLTVFYIDTMLGFLC